MPGADGATTATVSPGTTGRARRGDCGRGMSASTGIRSENDSPTSYDSAVAEPCRRSDRAELIEYRRPMDTALRRDGTVVVFAASPETSAAAAWTHPGRYITSAESVVAAKTLAASAPLLVDAEGFDLVFPHLWDEPATEDVTVVAPAPAPDALSNVTALAVPDENREARLAYAEHVAELALWRTTRAPRMLEICHGRDLLVETAASYAEEYVCLDGLEAPLETRRAALTAMGVPNSLACGPPLAATSLFRGASFDIVVVSAIADVAPDALYVWETLASLPDLLRKGGTLVVCGLSTEVTDAATIAVPQGFVYDWAVADDRLEDEVHVHAGPRRTSPDTGGHYDVVFRRKGDYLPSRQQPIVRLRRADRLERGEVGAGPRSLVVHDPRGSLVTTVQVAFEKALGKAVSLDDDFFTAGGHSLVAMRLVAHLRRETGSALPLRDFFLRPTVRGVVQYIEHAQ